ncbi:hypothetical protein HanXRQr2_Chr01g0008431 [Helianthus annuus]|uniref:Uncharacterized protein n=1 Tax=Helianthus annuus TaxID=4232 RepID=A0A9K3JTG1_HELAN|nr:hypothetical protein HanXRQr2_Chr01g0008431 [Helianthus annuus]KAJ0621509.1 hypothetical protein HanIR_Chr01g0009401 [Helianthus annuus]
MWAWWTPFDGKHKKRIMNHHYYHLDGSRGKQKGERSRPLQAYEDQPTDMSG